MRLTKKISFLTVYLLIPLLFLGPIIGGWACFLLFFLIFAFVPIIDFWLQDSTNAETSEENKLIADPYFTLITMVYVPVQGLVLISAVTVSHTVSLQWYEWFGFCLSTGLVTGGIGINLAHEFMHKNEKSQQWMSKILLVMVCYGHFAIEHVRGHHLRVATPNDPASAKLGESVYHFLPRTIIGSFRSAWLLEKNRLKQKNKPWYSDQNQFWWIIGAPLAILLLCTLAAGFFGALFFLLQSFMAILTLELVNYIEHYGLERQKLANGHYERVSVRHSWNANHWLSNTLLFHLQRHSDHHTSGSRPYQLLRHIEEGPQLPSGYIGMMFLALFPPCWRAVMDKRVREYRAKST